MTSPFAELPDRCLAPAMPKRLTAMMLLYVVAAVGGLITKQAVLLSLLTLLVVLAVFARQRAALWFLRGFTVVQLAMFCLLPLLLAQGEQLSGTLKPLTISADGIGVQQILVYALILAGGAAQLWLVFSAKVGRYFNRQQNFNLMS